MPPQPHTQRMRLTSLTISRRLQLLSGGMSVLLLLVGGTGLFLLRFIDQSSRHTLNEVNTARKAQVTFKIQVQEWKNILLRGRNPEQFAKYREAFQTENEHVHRLLAELKAMNDDPETDSHIDQLTTALTSLQSRYLTALEAYDPKDPEASVRVDAAVKGMDREPTKLMDDLVDSVEQNRRREADRMVLTCFILAGALLLAGMALAVVTARWISRSILGPLGAMNDRIRDIAEGDGDLTRRVEILSEDELARMAHQINRFIDQIHEIVSLIGQNSRAVGQSAARLAATSQSLAAAAEEFTQQSQSIAAATEEMHTNLQVVSSSIEEMSTSVEEVARQAAESADRTGEANTVSGEMNGEVESLGQNAKEVNAVISTISDIAGKTNLLALNASIEAAGAGDAGRGFAVVASEVKELARQTADSSDNIRERIQGMQTQVAKTIQSIGTISQMIHNVNQMTDLIAAAVEEQAITAREVSSNVNQLSTASSQVAHGIQTISDASRQSAVDAAATSEQAMHLQGLSAALLQAVDRFRV